jgi:hypothetical protein
MKTKKRTEAELKAMAYAIADEVETRVQPRIAAGMDRDKAIMLTIAQMSGHLVIVKG